MLPRYIILNKTRGLTPLETVSAWRKAEGIPNDIPTSYAGRLDPMAEGKLLVLIGDECKRQKEYTKLDKEYVIQVVLGIHTDTGDVLGIPTFADSLPVPSHTSIKTALASELGTNDRKYPVFSSKTVGGKPLFLYALEQTLDTIEVPSHPETFCALELQKAEVLTKAKLASLVTRSLSLTPTSDEPSKALGADFRINTIRPAWEELFKNGHHSEFPILSIKVTCGSGAYMRTLAERIGESLGTAGFALSIRRTRMGTYQKLPFGLGFWIKEYQ